MGLLVGVDVELVDLAAEGHALVRLQSPHRVPDRAVVARGHQDVLAEPRVKDRAAELLPVARLRHPPQLRRGQDRRVRVLPRRDPHLGQPGDVLGPSPSQLDSRVQCGQREHATEQFSANMVRRGATGRPQDGVRLQQQLPVLRDRDKLFTGDRSTEECLAELRVSRNTCDDVVFTGAEVTIRKDFFTLVQAARALGYRNIQVQTNGRMMAYRDFCERTVAAGANEFSPSIHGPTAKVHDALTRARGSFDQIVAAIEHLVDLDQRVVTNTVVAKQNLEHLPALADLLVKLGVAQFQLAFPHPTGHAATYFDQVVPRIEDARPFIHEALRIGIDAGVDCMAEAVPYCHMQGLERQVAELHIPPTEIVYDGYIVPDYAADRMARGKVRFEQCGPCRYEPICEGPWREYPERLGSDEFQPVAGPRIVDTDVVLDPRFDMLGTPAPPLPVARDTAWLALVFYAEDASASCTTQLQGLQRSLAELRARDIAIVGVSPDSESSHARFATDCGLAFPLLSDPDRTLGDAYRVRDRSTYLIDADGRIAHVLGRVDVANHTAQILAAVARLTAGPRPLDPSPPLVVLRRSAG